MMERHPLSPHALILTPRVSYISSLEPISGVLATSIAKCYVGDVAETIIYDACASACVCVRGHI